MGARAQRFDVDEALSREHGGQPVRGLARTAQLARQIRNRAAHGAPRQHGEHRMPTRVAARKPPLPGTSREHGASEIERRGGPADFGDEDRHFPTLAGEVLLRKGRLPRRSVARRPVVLA